MSSSSSQPLISVTLPNYNYGHYLAQAFDSVLMQTYENFEILFTDDGSTDGSVEIAQRYAREDPRIKANYFPKNQGVQVAHAATWRRVQGEIVYQFSSDDYIFSPDFFRLGVDAMTAHPRVAGFFGRSNVIVAETGESRALSGKAEPEGYVSPDVFLRGFLAKDFWVPGISSLWRKREIEAVGGYDSRLGPSADYFINHTLPSRCGVVFNPTVVAHTRIAFTRKTYSSGASLDAELRTFALCAMKMRQLVPNSQDLETEWGYWRRQRAMYLVNRHGAAACFEHGKTARSLVAEIPSL